MPGKKSAAKQTQTKSRAEIGKYHKETADDVIAVPTIRSTQEDPGLVPIEARIGAVIRRHRQANKLTLTELAAGAGVSLAMLSRIESGQTASSLDGLERICRAAGLTMADLFREIETKEGSAQRIRKSEQMEVVRSGTRHGHTYKLLSYRKGRRKTFEPFLIEMDKASEVYPRFRHEGTEFIYMLRGTMEYRFGDTTYLLEPGDALTFSAHIEHGPERLKDENITFLSIIFYEEAE